MDLITRANMLEHELEKFKVLTEMKKHAEPKRRAWDGINEHYFINYYVETRELFIVSASYCKGNDIYFESMEKAQNYIDIVGEDRILKYYIGAI